MGQIVRQGLHDKEVGKLIETYCRKQDIKDIDKISAMTLADLGALHAGAIIGLRITETQLDTWLSSKS